MYDNESPIMCVSCLTIFSNPNWEVTPSILEPLYEVMSLLNYRHVFVLKSPRTTVRKGLFTITEPWFNSDLLINDSKSSWDWLDERYNVMKLHRLSLIFVSKLMHYCK